MLMLFGHMSNLDLKLFGFNTVRNIYSIAQIYFYCQRNEHIDK